jgi:putative phosphoesterase
MLSAYSEGMATVVGVISDTHGLLRREAVEALRGSALILHAGDVGRPEILEDLATIAPVHAVRGNVDVEAWAGKLPARRTVRVEEAAIHILHDVGALHLPRGAAAVIYGHSHQPEIVERNGVLYVNPGSAGPARFRLPVSVARLMVDGAKVSAALIDLHS